MEPNKSQGSWGSYFQKAYIFKYVQRYFVIFIFIMKIVISQSCISLLG